MTDTVAINSTFPAQRETRRYGWLPDLPDNRDKLWKPKLSRRGTAPKLPKATYNRSSPFMPDIYDQSNLGSCTGNGVAGAFEFEQRRQGLVDYTPSRLFIYYEERRIINTLNQDSGAFIRDGLKVVNKLGAPHETLWQYDINAFATQPPQEAYDDGLKHKTTGYYTVDNRLQGPTKQALAAGFLVVMGFTVYPWFENPDSQGVCKPVANQQVLGGHCVCIVDYERLPVSRQVWCTVRNSWGTGWADHGYCYIPLAWFCDYYNADDFWVISQVAA